MILRGFRADSLLGWLAALGVSRLLDVGLRWCKDDTLWLAEIDYQDEAEDITQKLFNLCKQMPVPIQYGVDPGVKFDGDVNLWRSFASKHPEWAAALAGDCGSEILRSPLLMSSGGGHQHPLKMVEELTNRIELGDIESALNGNWIRHKSYGLRLDPTEAKSHAEQWDEPSKDPTPTVAWGPTRMAFEAFPLLPCSGVTWRAIYDLKGRIAKWPVWDRFAKGRALTALIWTTPPAFQCERTHFDKGNYNLSATMPV